jgi:hypothetical protein
MTKFIANRDDERRLFVRMIGRQVRERILLIEAQSETGKTELMERFAEISRTDNTVHVNLKLAKTGVAYVFWRIRESLGEDCFPKYKMAMQGIYSPLNVNISDNELSDDARIQFAIWNDIPHSKLHLQQLFEALIEDLRNINRQIVMLFDTFDKADEELQEWVTGSLLVAVARNAPNVIAVVAGQNVPRRELEWWPCTRKVDGLGPITDFQAWYSFVQKCNLPVALSTNQVKEIVESNKGMPKAVQDSIQTLVAYHKQGIVRVSSQSLEPRELPLLTSPAGNATPQIDTTKAISSIEQQPREAVKSHGRELIA